MSLNSVELAGSLSPRIERGDEYAYMNFRESESLALSAIARVVHARSYRGEGFVHDEAIAQDGTLARDIDKARGSMVDYYLGYQLGSEGAVPVSTLRKINLQPGETAESLPGFQACRDVLYKDERRCLLAGTAVKEISSFGHVPEVSALAGLELMRHVLQDSSGEGELWFFSMVAEKYGTLVSMFGPRAVQKAGDPVTLQDSRINNVSLVPAIVDVDRFYDNIYNTLEVAGGARRRRHLASLAYFAEGMEDRLSDEVTEVVAQFKKGLSDG